MGICSKTPALYYLLTADLSDAVWRGIVFVLDRPVAPSWSPFVTYTGTRIENSPCPPTEYYLDIGKETHRMMMEHKLYPSSVFFFCYRSGAFMINADFARLRWGDTKYSEHRDPCMLREKVTV